ncbi:hypothetical protein CTA2_1787 [Colletotrichum tanaceti]|nr:hypothetical protein CTA2_1787 [Colletotrichum tanaceti]
MQCPQRRRPAPRRRRRRPREERCRADPEPRGRDQEPAQGHPQGGAPRAGDGVPAGPRAAGRHPPAAQEGRPRGAEPGPVRVHRRARRGREAGPARRGDEPLEAPVAAVLHHHPKLHRRGDPGMGPDRLQRRQPGVPRGARDPRCRRLGLRPRRERGRLREEQLDHRPRQLHALHHHLPLCRLDLGPPQRTPRPPRRHLRRRHLLADCAVRHGRLADLGPARGV